VENLENILNTNRTFTLGGKNRGSHFTDFGCFVLVLSSITLTVGISAYDHMNIVEREVENHRPEFSNFYDHDPLVQARIVKLMITNLATYYLAELLCVELKKLSIPGISEICCAATGGANIYRNNHRLIKGQFHIEPRMLIRVLLSLGITTFSVAGAGEDIAAAILGNPLSRGNKLWNLRPGENPQGQLVTSDMTFSFLLEICWYYLQPTKLRRLESLENPVAQLEKQLFLCNTE